MKFLAVIGLAIMSAITMTGKRQRLGVIAMNRTVSMSDWAELCSGHCS